MLIQNTMMRRNIKLQRIYRLSVLLTILLVILPACAAAGASSDKADKNQSAGGPSAVTPVPQVQTTGTAVAQSPAQTVQSVTPSVPVTAKPATVTAAVPANTEPAAPLSSNRLDVVYFHPNLRCETCLCFEDHINKIIANYYQDKINSGKLTYRVVNIQDKQNAAIVKKYKPVGSQLFINNVINDFDNIEDIQDIWSWHCVDSPADFEMRVRSVIDLYLKGKP